jgi:hypothetical protein
MKIPRLFFRSFLILFLRLEPLLYHALVWRGGPMSRTIPHRLRDIMDETYAGPTDFVERHVRHLAFTGQLAVIPKMLRVCSGATDLAFYSPVMPSFISHLDRIRPTRLLINIRQLFGGAADFSRSMFINITHLACTDPTLSDLESWKKNLAALPCLTHLSFNPSRFQLLGDFLHVILSHCTRLHALILFLQPAEFDWVLADNEYGCLHAAFPAHDVRFLIPEYFAGKDLDGWVAGAWGCADVWVQADNFIRMKRCGDIYGEWGFRFTYNYRPDLDFEDGCCFMDYEEFLRPSGHPWNLDNEPRPRKQRRPIIDKNT